MNCFNHSETPAVAYCRACGKALCNDCKRTAQGTIFCDEHAPAAAPGPSVGTEPRPSVAEPRFAEPRFAEPRPSGSGMPVGSIATNDVSPGLACLLGFIPGVGAIYNGQYAKGLVHAIVFGLLVSITSSGSAGDLEPLFGSGFPIGAITLIGLGVLLLLSTMDIIQLRYLLRYWPVLLILAGAYMLYVRIEGGGENSIRQEVRHERQ